MANPGWSQTASPFHAGELAIQARLGIQEQMDKQGRRVIRDYLPDQFRQFFAQLPYVIVGTIDATGNPWASILVGTPGFLSTPDDRTLKVVTQPLLGDPFAANLAQGTNIGLLGIELPTRRRNRVNGIVTVIDSDGFEVQVQQSFGNCPQYIQVRRSEWAEGDSTTKFPHSIDRLGEREQTLITTADTFFIATAYQAESAGAASGVDVSHRGGKPGFIRLEGDRTLTIPDFSGNHHFNTFGNLEVNPRAGLLLIDFSQGHLLYLTGTAEVIWEGAEILTYAGAERLLRFHLQSGYYVERSLPLRWSDPEFSPFLAD
ncbi:pyridoxamine 5'-phosphate oxidase family protein [Alkalinema sp. FACHB-956]|uniref:pyridoxamine 5'-phosphate oxidase family protein n=1 Tax=Alkalinema sp. FACHB-956 TaxID=2692768 RepID=UPI00168734D9|nr:pyridoxamine 5'-phosphate oxidase family protein [Alkalinema sp. FACHB-956]MBD2329943.1 pyridoxamine 5'-phosphate oxidase family protein [Alkalinema sp. FACHB-956]